MLPSSIEPPRFRFPPSLTSQWHGHVNTTTATTTACATIKLSLTAVGRMACAKRLRRRTRTSSAAVECRRVVATAFRASRSLRQFISLPPFLQSNQGYTPACQHRVRLSAVSHSQRQSVTWGQKEHVVQQFGLPKINQCLNLDLLCAQGSALERSNSCPEVAKRKKR